MPYCFKNLSRRKFVTNLFGVNMDDNEQLLQRKEEIEKSLVSLKKILAKRNGLLTSLEEKIMFRTMSRENTLLNNRARGSKFNFMLLVRKVLEKEANYARHLVFLLMKRRRRLLAELDLVVKKIEVNSKDHSLPNP